MEQNQSNNGSAAKRNTKYDEQLRKRLQILFETQSRGRAATVSPKIKKFPMKSAAKEKLPQRKVSPVRQNLPEQAIKTKKHTQKQQSSIPKQKKNRTTNKNKKHPKPSGSSKKLDGISEVQKVTKLQKTTKKVVNPPLETKKKTAQKHTLNRLKRDSNGKAIKVENTWKEAELKIPKKKQKLDKSTLQQLDEYESNSTSDFSEENVEWEYSHNSDSDSNFSGSEYSFSRFTEGKDTMNNFVDSDCFEETNSDEDFSISDEDFEGFDWAEEDENCSFGEDEIGLFNGESDDEDYHLPENVPEDLIIHKGTATKRNLEASDCVQFREDCEEGQIIEIECREQVKIIKQPEEYKRAALEELNKKEIPTKQEHLMPKNDVEASCETDCPQLVPIAVDNSRIGNESDDVWSNDDDSFESCSCEEFSDQDGSIISTDVNSKYLQHCEDVDEMSTDDEKDGFCKRRSTMYAEVIEAESSAGFEEKRKHAVCIDEKDNINIPDLLPSELLIPALNGNCEKSTVVSIKILGDATKAHKTAKDTKVQQNIYYPKDAAVTNCEQEVVANASTNNVADKIAKDAKVHQNKYYHKEAAVKNCEEEVVANPNTNNVDEVNPLLNSQLPFPTATQSDNNSSQQNAAPATSYRSIFCNSKDLKHVLVLLLEPMYIYGTVKLLPMIGTLDVYGYTPRLGEELELFSPRGLCSVSIAPKRNAELAPRVISTELKNLEAFFCKDDIEKVRNNFCPDAALIILQRNNQRKNLISTLQKYMNENLFPNMKAIQMERPHYSSENLLDCVINMVDDREKTFKLNPQWNQMKLQPNSKILIIGGKSVGKSTMLRYLVNRYLAHRSGVLVIDLDIGQPELFVPLTISASVVKQPLLGPGFFLNKQPIKSFGIGHSNVVLCPHSYMLAVKELLEILSTSTEYAQMPWLVNTMGYNKGFGAELIAVICEFLQPTDVVQLQSNKDINNFDYLMASHVVAEIPRNIYADEIYRGYRADTVNNAAPYKLHVFNSAVLQESRYQRDWEMSAKDMRYAIMLTRLSELLDSNAEWLTDSKSLCASLDDFKVISLLPGQNTLEQILKSIDANLVYFCRMHNDKIVECFGIGVVRVIDYRINQVYLWPAFPHTRITEINCLAIADMPMPTSMVNNQGLKVTNTTPFMVNTMDDNATKSIKQIYYRPTEFLSGKHRHIV